MTIWSLFCQSIGLVALFPNSKLFNVEGYGGWVRDSVRQVDIITGCFLLTTRNFWEELEGFDPIFFMYGEEADFCLRARKCGARPLFTPNATIIHYYGASESGVVDKLVKLFASRITLAKRHWSPAGPDTWIVTYLV